MIWQQRLFSALEKRRTVDAMRTRTVVESGAGRFLYCCGRKFYNFSTNDYLNISQHPAVIQAWQNGADRYGVGSGGSGHINGYTSAHKELEEALADWLGYPRALLFISGFSANQALITTLVDKNDMIIADKLSHASLLEAANLNRAKLRRFVHNDVKHLNMLLNKPCDGQKLVITEGIFSMEGNSAPLKDIISIAKTHNTWTLVDDAHGIGVIGDQGRGSINIHEVRPELLVITFGKCFGVSGAAVLCSEMVAEYLLHFACHLIYSTSMPPAQAVALLTALELIRGKDGEFKRKVLSKRIQQFRNGIAKLKFQVIDSNSAIQSLIVGDNKSTLKLANILRDQGIWTTAIRPPTVPLGTARLRLTINASHTPHDINTLLEVLHAVSE